MKLKTIYVKYSTLLLLIAGTYFLGGCSKENESKEAKAISTIETSDDGKVITFPANSTGLDRIKSVTISKKNAMISVFAPARVVASISSAISSNEKIVLFESPDIATLYSQYKQAKSNVLLTGKNLERIQDMYKNLAATGKDVNQAENDAANARATMEEMESRLRTAGFNPKELNETPAGTIWMIADVLENQLHEVDRGESVDVFLNSFPAKKFTGRAAAIGDVVDPTTRTVKVRISLKDPKKQFLPGMFGKVDFGDPHDGIILIPLSSVVTFEGKDFVFIQTGIAEFKRQEVILGEQNDNEIVVQGGIQDGDKVVTEGAILLKGLSFKY